MEFEVVFYEDEHGNRPVEEFLDDLQKRQPGLYRLTEAGIKKLENSEKHREPLTKDIGDDLYELRVGRKNLARVIWFFMTGARVVLAHGFVKKTDKIPPADKRKALERKADYLRRFGASG